MDRKKYRNYEISIKKLGLSIDWDKEISTVMKSIITSTRNFIDFYNNGLVSEKKHM